MKKHWPSTQRMLDRAGAALDVFEKEPLPADSPLLDTEIEDRCRLFHHFASAGCCMQRLMDVLEKVMAAI